LGYLQNDLIFSEFWDGDLDFCNRDDFKSI